MTPETYFEDQELPRQLFEVVRSALDDIGDAELHVTKSQIAFRRRRAFAWVWMPAQYLGTAKSRRHPLAPLVLTLAFHRRDASARWKEIVEPAPGRFTHHLELYAVSDVDDQVRDWLRDAWLLAA